MKRSVIIAAAGAGTRMMNETPKQFQLLMGIPVLMHTIKKFDFSDIEIVVVLPEGFSDLWKKMINEFSFPVKHKIIAGGRTRSESVRNGLATISEGVVAIHDAARPMVTKDLIEKAFSECVIYSNAIPAITIPDSVRKIQGNSSSIIERNDLRIIQTPQCFDVTKLKKAYANFTGNSTDDAGVFEADGNSIHLIEGEKNNLKITVPDDLKVCEAILSAKYTSTGKIL
jgi:2-C-methyl-D-erythritol 4-phosphate cytidylyltransferase